MGQAHPDIVLAHVEAVCILGNVRRVGIGVALVVEEVLLLQRAVVFGDQLEVVGRIAAAARAVLFIVRLREFVVLLHGQGHQNRILRHGQGHTALVKDRLAVFVKARQQVIAVEIQERPAEDDLVFVVGLKGGSEFRRARFGKFLADVGGE